MKTILEAVLIVASACLLNACGPDGFASMPPEHVDAGEQCLPAGTPCAVGSRDGTPDQDLPCCQGLICGGKREELSCVVDPSIN